MNKDELPDKIKKQLYIIEAENKIRIDLTRFSRTSKPTVSLNSGFLINFEHEAFQSLLSDADGLTDEIVRIYLLGVLGIGISKLQSGNP